MQLPQGFVFDGHFDVAEDHLEVHELRRAEEIDLADGTGDALAEALK